MPRSRAVEFHCPHSVPISLQTEYLNGVERAMRTLTRAPGHNLERASQPWSNIFRSRSRLCAPRTARPREREWDPALAIQSLEVTPTAEIPMEIETG